MTKISRTVEKLGQIPSFNLPALTTCPHATPACKRYCYALRGRFLYPDAQAALYRNFLGTRSDSFIDDILKQLSISVKFFRIHASGDFYSKAYFNKWLKIAETRPDIKFMAYTRNWTLDLTGCPSNLIIYFTIDPTTERINKTAKYTATVIYDNSLKQAGHLEVVGNAFVCNFNDCDNCGVCWSNPNNLIFPQKYHTLNKELIMLTS